jgi:hypothetical protein
MEIIKNIAAVIGCITAFITLLTIIFKPIRQRIVDSVSHKSQSEKLLKDIKDIKDIVGGLKEDNQEIQTRLDRVEKNVLENEADRIRTELFDCGNRCRRGIRLHPEEMEHIRTIYHKYKDTLHQNHEGDSEFDFINKYYNHQSFPAYHIQQND